MRVCLLLYCYFSHIDDDGYEPSQFSPSVLFFISTNGCYRFYFKYLKKNNTNTKSYKMLKLKDKRLELERRRNLNLSTLYRRDMLIRPIPGFMYCYRVFHIFIFHYDFNQEFLYMELQFLVLHNHWKNKTLTFSLDKIFRRLRRDWESCSKD